MIFFDLFDRDRDEICELLIMFLKLLKNLQAGNDEIKEGISNINLFSQSIFTEYIKSLIIKVIILFLKV